MIPDDPAQDDDDQELTDLADELTEQNRVELMLRALNDQSTALDAMECFLENQGPRDISGLLWDVRHHSPGIQAWFREAAKQWAKDNAERVTPEQLDAARRDEYVEMEE